MNWITVIWSGGIGACLVLALMHLLVWCRDRRSWANLCFLVMIAGVVGLGVCELIAMRTKSPEVFGAAVRWAHLINGLGVAANIGFVHFYFGTGRKGLLFTALGLRALAIVANFTTGMNLHFTEIIRLGEMPFLGESVSMVEEWVANPWVRLGQFATLVQLVYCVDASMRLWREGSRDSRGRALRIGGSIVFFAIVAAGLPGLVSAGVIKVPLLISYSFFGIVLAISYELSRNLLRASRLARDLETSERRLALAANSARLALWEWDLLRDRIWISDDGRALYGMGRDRAIDFKAFLATLHEDDRSAVDKAVKEAVAGGTRFTTDYRVVLPDGRIIWITAVGRVERDGQGRPVLLRGVSIDVSERKLAEQDAALHRGELAHLSRVSLLGELAGSLAHELNQPLAAILSNAQVGGRGLLMDPPYGRELGEILEDIVADAKRAGGIIHGMRAMFKKDARIEVHPVDLNGLTTQVLKLLNSEIIARKVSVKFNVSESLPRVLASGVEIQQVLINLILNSLDALAGEAHGLIEITTGEEGGKVLLTLHDNGPGIAEAMRARLFEPFASTKEAGLGLGLSISRGIVERFDGTLEALPGTGCRGAVFRLALPIEDA